MVRLAGRRSRRCCSTRSCSAARLRGRLALGDLLSMRVRSTPGYLSLAFPLGSQRIITLAERPIAAGAGALAACIGVLMPIGISVVQNAAAAMSHRHRIRSRRMVELMGGLSCLSRVRRSSYRRAAVRRPRQRDPGGRAAAPAAALLDLIVAIVGSLHAISERGHRIAVIELRSPKTRSGRSRSPRRGVAVFGSVAIQGANAISNMGWTAYGTNLGTTDLWVVPPAHRACSPRRRSRTTAASRLERLPESERRRIARGFLNYGGRRVWVLAPPPTARGPMPPSQLVTGNLALANSRLREGGWAVISKGSRTRIICMSGRHSHCHRRMRELSNRGTDDKSGMAAGCDRPRRRRLCTRMGKPRSERLQRDARPRALSTTGRREIQGVLGPVGADWSKLLRSGNGPNKPLVARDWGV